MRTKIISHENVFKYLSAYLPIRGKEILRRDYIRWQVDSFFTKKSSYSGGNRYYTIIVLILLPSSDRSERNFAKYELQYR